jgi:hypothetical protein
MPPRKHKKSHQRKGKGQHKMKGQGIFDAIGDAFKSIPTAVTQVVNGVRGALDNRNEVINRGQQLIDIGKRGVELGNQVLPYLPLIGGKKRGRGMPTPSPNQFLPSDRPLHSGLNQVVV